MPVPSGLRENAVAEWKVRSRRRWRRHLREWGRPAGAKGRQRPVASLPAAD